jgi:hypothetical protein
MRVVVRALLTILMTTVGARQAHAQNQSVIGTVCGHPLLGVAGGLALNNDRHGGESSHPDGPSGIGLDLAASFERPVHPAWNARFDVGTVAWTFQADDVLGAPQLRDRVRLTRITFSAVPVTPQACRWPLRLYAGGGLGVYHYRSDNGDVDATRLGIQGFAGFDLLVSDRTAVTTEVGVHVVGGPDAPPVFSVILWALRAHVGVRIRF